MAWATIKLCVLDHEGTDGDGMSILGAREDILADGSGACLIVPIVGIFWATGPDPNDYVKFDERKVML